MIYNIDLQNSTDNEGCIQSNKMFSDSVILQAVLLWKV